ncbi:hypothetical protein B0H14DRAFT_3124476 [Mycena olivaceomarginata]|nr:hypothetical protein B0H14DRAFT_3124476 [Mycena olivaceomarginata]
MTKPHFNAKQNPWPPNGESEKAKIEFTTDKGERFGQWARMLDIKISFNGTSFELEVSENDELRVPAAGGPGPFQTTSSIGGENPGTSASSMTGGSVMTAPSFSPLSSQSATVSSPGVFALPNVSANESRVSSLMGGNSMMGGSSGVAPGERNGTNLHILQNKLKIFDIWRLTLKKHFFGSLLMKELFLGLKKQIRRVRKVQQVMWDD